jgi:hypothetical protein
MKRFSHYLQDLDNISKTTFYAFKLQYQTLLLLYLFI